jgi:hypothetical protein
MFHPFLAAALVAATAVCAGAIVSPAPLMTYSGSSHYDFGVSMGRQMSELIANRCVRCRPLDGETWQPLALAIERTQARVVPHRCVIVCFRFLGDCFTWQLSAEHRPQRPARLGVHPRRRCLGGPGAVLPPLRRRVVPVLYVSGCATAVRVTVPCLVCRLQCSPPPVQQYKTLHESLFPDYMQEIQGIADGSGQARPVTRARSPHTCLSVHTQVVHVHTRCPCV